MNHIQLLAILLLVERLAAVTFISMVLRRQYNLFKYKVDTGLVKLRLIMFGLALVFLLGNVVPIAVDIYYAFISVPGGADFILQVYTLSNATISLTAAIFLWLIYKIAEGEMDERSDEE